MSNEPLSERQDNRSSSIRSIVDLVGFISLRAAILGVFAAFLGWRASSAYLLTFGIEPSWLSFEFISLVVNGWVEVLFLLLLLALLVLSRHILLTTVNSLQDSKLADLTALFAGLTALLSVLFFVRFWYWTETFFEFVVLTGLLLMSWWGLITCGEYLIVEKKFVPVRVPAVIWTPIASLFSSRVVQFLITVAFIVFITLNFAVSRGTHFGLRDQTLSSHLSRVSLVSSVPLHIPGGASIDPTDAEGNLFLYDNLRLVIRTDEYVFLFRPEEVEASTGAVQVYVVPAQKIESLTLQQWYWPVPAVVPDVTVSP